MNTTAMGSIFQSFFGIASVIVIAGVLMTLLGVVAIVLFLFKQGAGNRKSPRVCISAKVLGKRTRYTHHSDDMHMARYYVTFEADSGERMEFLVPSSEYGLLFEGDQGDLTFQGTRFISFIRKIH